MTFAPSAPSHPANRRDGSPVASGRPRTEAHARAEANARLVWLVLARHFPSLREDPERQRDAYTAGYVALLGACERFDASLGFTFATYAARCVRGGVLRHLKTERRQGQIPTVSLETPIGENGSDLADMIADTQAEKPGQSLLDQVGFDALLAGLPQRQQEVLRAMYAEERPLSEIAEGMGVTKQRAGQIHLQALAALRKGHGDVSLTPQDVAATKRQQA